MTQDMMTLRALLEKSSDADLLREMIGFTAERLMALEVEGLTGAAHGERSADWTHPGKVEAPYTVCIASASNLTGLVKSSVECRRTGL